MIVWLLLEVYGYIRSLAATRRGPALAHGRDILDIERWLHLDVELGANHWLTRHEDLSRVAVNVYQHAHTGLTMSVLMGCYILGPRVYRPARNSLVLMNLVGLAVFFVMPVMPPRLLPDEGFIDTVAVAGFGTTHGGPVPADQYAAMPSLHLAWAVWVMAVFVAVLRPYRLGWITALHPITTGIVVVATANHYVLDVVAGVAVAVGANYVTGLSRAGDRTAWTWRPLIRRRGGTDDADSAVVIRHPGPAAEDGAEKPVHNGNGAVPSGEAKAEAEESTA
ncbi:phosphatase PAP2 family protein [Actinomadura yumaensis]|uniref:Phosphatase PAP2 family protein n=2 Tax=Thermomonosporaceae TaxID=2012 RepID=A0ABW2CHY0_9ACTN